MFTLYVVAFICAFATTVLITPFVGALAKRFNVLDMPDERKIHTQPIPRWGGIGLYAGFIISLLFLFLFPRTNMLLKYKQDDFKLKKEFKCPKRDCNFKSLKPDKCPKHKKSLVRIFTKEYIGKTELSKQFAGIIIGATIIFILGVIDDKKNILAIVKLPFQIIAALVVINYGVAISGIGIPGYGYQQLPLLFSQIVTVIWIVGFMNTINFIDGLDGLAAGIVAIAAGTFFVVALLQGKTEIILFSKQLKLAAILCAALCGASVGFLFHNFFPAKIFMGDSGSQFLGFILGAIAVIGTLKTTAVFAIFIPMIVIALPVLDVAFSILRRYRTKKPIMDADSGHFHHRLLKLGWTQREIVLLMYILTGVLGVASILLAVFRGTIYLK